MMKKNGFTLAEVLITLSIIGVVAALTLPSLNLGVQASKVGPSLRKFINTMSNANEMILANNQSNSLRSVYTDQQVADYMTALSGQIRGTGIANNFGATYTGDDHTAKEYGPNGRRFVSMTVNGANGQDNRNDNINIQNFSIFNFDSGETMAIGLRAGNIQQRADQSSAHRGVFADVIFDIDGVNSGANKLGTDLFVFRVDNNGSVIPVGGSAEANAGYVNNSVHRYIDRIVNGRLVRVDLGVTFTPSRDARWNTGNDLCNANRVNSGVNCAGSVADNNWRVIYQY